MGVREASAKYQIAGEAVAAGDNVPEGFKRSEVGLIPLDWDTSRIGAEFSIQLGKMLDAEKNIGVSKPFLGNRSVQWGNIDISDLEEIKLTPRDLARYRLSCGDLLVCEGGEVGRAAIWGDQLSECYYQKALHRLRPKREYSPQLLMNLLQEMARSGRLQNFVTQTSIAHLPKDKFETIPIPLPASTEQKAIAEALSDADALIESLQQLIAKKRALKQGVMQALLTGRQRLPGFAGEWREFQFRDLAELRQERINPRVEDVQDFCIELEHISSDTGRLNGHTSTTQQSSLKTMFRPGDILFGKLRAYLRKYWLADRPGVCSTEIWCLCPSGPLSSSELLFQLVQTDEFIETASVSYGTHMPRSEWSSVSQCRFNLPVDTREQAAIATVLSDMDAEIDALEARLAKARALKAGMMQALLTGRIRLPLDEAA